MFVSFADLGLDSSSFNGMAYADARKQIINLAADRVNNRYAHPETAIETLYDWPNAVVCFIRCNVFLPPAKFDRWCALNS
jgi:hypothetical protein